MKISVVLSTYNGEKYLLEQLESIRKQTLQANEVIISDDCSSDNTVQLVQEFINKYSLKNWKLIANRVNRGWMVNFKETLKLASGDLIFPCDQDDIWHEDKLQSMSEVMEDNPHIFLLASNYTTFYEEGGKKLLQNHGEKLNDKSLVKIDFNEQNFFVLRPGCVYCFRRELLKYYDKYAVDDDPHDAFLWRISELLDGLYVWNYSTIDYRRHSSNATARIRPTRSSKLETVLYYDRILKMLSDFSENENIKDQENKEKIIQRLTEWNSLRIRVIKRKDIISLIYWLKLYRYRDCYFSNKSYLADLVLLK